MSTKDAASIRSRATQYLSFTLGQEVYAIEIEKVREVLDYATITRVPRMPEYMRGVLNLRGRAVPVVDMRMKFGMQATERTVNTCVIILEVAAGGGDGAVIGALADSVREVFDLLEEDVEPAPRIGTQLRAEFLRGMGKREGGFVLLLDMDTVFSGEEMEAALSAPRDRQGNGLEPAGRNRR